MTDKLVELFGKEHPGYTRQDFYELELATSGMLRSFMAASVTGASPWSRSCGGSCPAA